MKKSLIYIIIAALIAIIVWVPGVKNYLKDAFFPVATIENAVHISAEDYDVELKGINTADANLKDFKGRPLLLNFWGTWCPPCRKEWPSIQKLYDGRKQEVGFVLIAMQDEEQKLREFLKENNYTAPVYVAQSPISEKILPKVFPTTFLLDKNGRILLKEDAATDWNASSVHKLLDNILAAK